MATRKELEKLKSGDKILISNRYDGGNKDGNVERYFVSILGPEFTESVIYSPTLTSNSFGSLSFCQMGFVTIEKKEEKVTFFEGQDGVCSMVRVDSAEYDNLKKSLFFKEIWVNGNKIVRN